MPVEDYIDLPGLEKWDFILNVLNVLIGVWKGVKCITKAIRSKSPKEQLWWLGKFKY